MKHYIDQLECKKMKEGDLLFDAPLTDHLFLFVLYGALEVGLPGIAPEISLNEKQFMLLTAGPYYPITALTAARILLIKTSSLPDLLTDDPQWKPDRPVVLPIFPALAHKLRLIELEYKQRHRHLN